MSALLTDPRAESPDVIDERDPADPSHFDPKPGDPSVTPGITLPTTIPPGWTIAADGSMVPLAEDPAPVGGVVTLPEMTITGTAPSSSGIGEVLFVAACAVGGFFLARSLFR